MSVAPTSELAPELSEILEVDEHDFHIHAYEQGWTEGLPIVPPTPERVDALVAATGRDPLEVLGIMPPAQGVTTIHAVAVNAVMAGCSPAHFPVVVAAVRAVLDPRFNLYGVQATTQAVTPLLMVNGPIIDELGFNAGHNCLGPKSRASAVVGRALRLCLLNIGGAIPGETDMSTHGQPGKYGICFAENEPASPWEPFHVEHGFDPDASCVTAFQVGSIASMLDFGSKTAEELLLMLADLLSANHSNNMQVGGGDLLVVICPEHAGILERENVTKDQVKRFLHQNARKPAHRIPSGVLGCIRDWRREALPIIGPETPIPVVDEWEWINVVVSGGAAGSHSLFLPGFGDGWAVTVEI
jgi:hypothetical protein